MSTPTKVIAVLLVVFAITFTMMTLQYVARNTRWKDLAETYRQTAFAAVTHERNATAVLLAQLEVMQDKNEALRRTSQSVQQALDGANETLGQTSADLARSTADLSASTARETSLGKQLELETARANLNDQQKNEGRKQVIVLQQRNTDLIARNNELTTRVAILHTQVRGLQQRAYALEEDNKKLRAIMPVAAGAPFDTTTVGKPGDKIEDVDPTVSGAIRGAIASVQPDSDIATIDVGSADGVRAGMVFLISRADDLVGTLKISDVKPNEAGGRLEVEPDHSIRPGDQVIDEASLLRGL